MTAAASTSPVEAFLPPEGVPISFDLAGLGRRIAAMLIDLAISYGALLAGILLIGWSRGLNGPAFVTLLLLASFLARSPYLILSELIWNGRTLGKRLLRLRVISADGGRLTPHQIAARNLTKEVELFLPFSMLFTISADHVVSSLVALLWIVGVAVVPFRSGRRQRIGDLIAGTLVVRMPAATLLDDLVLSPVAGGGPAFTPAQLDIYGRRELQALEEILRRPARTAAERAERHQVCATIRGKIGFDAPVPDGEEEAFLRVFYRAQREYLERRQLFGDRRDDKFHRLRSGDDPRP